LGNAESTECNVVLPRRGRGIIGVVSMIRWRRGMWEDGGVLGGEHSPSSGSVFILSLRLNELVEVTGIEGIGSSIAMG
jgi:hypothetical protein